MTPLADGEGFTTDGGGNAPVKLVACNGRHLTLTADVDWKRWTHNGACAARICIMDGTGAGQSRKIASYKGREAELEQPWTLPPDATSVLHLIPDLFRQNLIVGNQFHDARCCRATPGRSTGFSLATTSSGRRNPNFSHPGDPAWYMQCLDNEIDVGSGYRGPNNGQPPSDSELAIASGHARCQVLRRNVLHNNARITVTGAPDVLIEHNSISDAEIGIDAGRSLKTLLWGNRFERIKEPLVGLTEQLVMNPADRILNQLSAVRESLPSGSGKTIDRLKELAATDPHSPGLKEEVRACVLQLLQQASASPKDYSLEFLRAVLGDGCVLGHAGQVPTDTGRPGRQGRGMVLCDAACTALGPFGYRWSFRRRPLAEWRMSRNWRSIPKWAGASIFPARFSRV